MIQFIIIFNLFINSNISASLLADSNTIFNWGEDNYSELLSPARPATQFINGWRYRYYTGTNHYLGVNDQGEIYLLDGSPNSNSMYIDTTENLLKTIQNNIKNNNKLISRGNLNQCKTLPLGKVDKAIKGSFELFSNSLDFLVSVLETDKLNRFITEVVVISPEEPEKEIAPIILDISYDIFSLDGQDFRVITNIVETDIIKNIITFTDNYVIPVNWCKGMKWQTTLKRNNGVDNSYEIFVEKINDSVTLSNAEPRQAVKVIISQIDGDPIYFIWLDIETGYPIKIVDNMADSSISVTEIVDK